MLRPFLTGCLLAATALTSQAQVSNDWVNQPGGVSVALNAAGEVYTSRGDYNPGGDIFLTKRSAVGAVLL